MAGHVYGERPYINILGRKIVDTKYVKRRGWWQEGIALVLDDGTVVEVWGDEEGNHPGHLVFYPRRRPPARMVPG